MELEKEQKQTELEQEKTKEALVLAINNEKLADRRREEAETLAVRIQLEHYFSKAEDRPDLALVGMGRNDGRGLYSDPQDAKRRPIRLATLDRRPRRCGETRMSSG